MTEVKCFLVVDTGRDRLYLRRYARVASKCTGPMGYHNVSVSIGETDTPGACESSDAPPAGYESDSRWPTHCTCGYEFQASDHWQLFRRSIYCRDTGEEWVQEELPAGAMYDAPWLKGVGGRNVGSDGLALHVVCPPARGWCDHWHVDGPANNGPGWERTGDPPNVTATPSIQTPRYHGWLRNGVLVEC